MANGKIFDTLERVEELIPEWDELAVALARPFCAPAWMLSWWRHVAPRRARLLVVAVREGDELIGVGPFFASPESFGLVRYRILGSETSYRVTPLARPGREREVASTIVDALVAAGPSPDVLSFEGIEPDSPWPELFREVWPGHAPPWKYRVRTLPAPTVTLQGRSFDEWLSSRSSHFRKRARQYRRRLEEIGAEFKLAQSENERERHLEAFARLHYQRWKSRGGSRALDQRIELMISDVAHRLPLGERFRLWSIEVEGQIISVKVIVAAGGEAGWWLTGFDEAWAKYRPSTQTGLAAIAQSCALREDRLDLGGGAQEYKYHFADGQDELEWIDLVPRGRWHLLNRARLAPGHAIWKAYSVYSERMPAAMQRRLEKPIGGAARLLRDRQRRQ
jgi:CelD/BcsL family acetyltransferase involved in cellulose biosynthesis